MKIIAGLILSSWVVFGVVLSLADTLLSKTGIVGEFFQNVIENSFVVSIRINDLHKCGGCLFKRDVVISSAHCLKKVRKDPSKITVHAGSKSANFLSQSKYEVKAIKIHENYNSKRMTDDIAIILLDTVVDFDVSIKLRIVPTQAGSSLLTCGWGMASDIWPLSIVRQFSLQCTDLKIYDQAKCENEFKYPNITDRMLCAYGNAGHGCTGISGELLVSSDKKKLVGIFSYGVGCAPMNTPGVYTNVAKYVLWIQETIATFRNLALQ